MTQTVKYEVEDGVAVLSVNNPPVNALSASVRAGLIEGLDQALSDATVQVILIMGQGRTFPAGADISEFGKPPVDPWLPEVCNRFEASPKPVVAAIHGTALGGGFELALAAHYRLANRGARIGLPEVTLGILPGAGGTQRTPRVAGAELALDMMLSGSPMPATTPEAAVFFDKIIEGDLRAGAIEFAQELITTNAQPRPTRDESGGLQNPKGFQAAIAALQKPVRRAAELAPKEILRCVEAAALLPFEQGMEFERAAFEQCVQSDQSAALRHAFFAERRAAKFPELQTGKARDLRQVGIVGGGFRGRDLAQICLAAGFEVTLMDRDSTVLVKACSRIEARLLKAESAGVLSLGARQNQIDRLSGTVDFADLADADLVIEAVPEDLPGKLDIFAQLDGIVQEGTVLATTTPAPDLDRIADETGIPGDVLGLHFYDSVKDANLVEVVVGSETTADTVATGHNLVQRLRKVAVRTSCADGFIAQRMMAAYRFAADLMLEQGATPYIVDAAMKAYGMSLGPYRQLDREGLATSWTRRQRLAKSGAPGGDHLAVSDALCKVGRLGRKVGKGYYRYDTEAPKGANDPDVIDIIRTARDGKGIRARRVDEDEIQRRCLAAMVNEGARLLREGVARCASDIDMAMIHGCGFPRWRGGPMMAAELSGLLSVQRDLEDYATEDAWFWTPDPVFQDLIKNGRGFSDMNDEVR